MLLAHSRCCWPFLPASFATDTPIYPPNPLLLATTQAQFFSALSPECSHGLLFSLTQSFFYTTDILIFLEQILNMSPKCSKIWRGSLLFSQLIANYHIMLFHIFSTFCLIIILTIPLQQWYLFTGGKCDWHLWKSYESDRSRNKHKNSYIITRDSGTPDYVACFSQIVLLLITYFLFITAIVIALAITIIHSQQSL